MSASSFQVDRKDMSITRFVDLADDPTATGEEVILRVDQFALTANNITYGVAGDIIGYWQFFPAQLPWGQIPVWGIGTVTASGLPDISTGTRYYGYFPMASWLRVKPARFSERGFTDASEHRSQLPSVYNQYSLMTEANGFEPGTDDHQMVYRPLFTTSFVLDDYLRDNSYFGARRVILSSASSKTAFGLAFLLHLAGDVSVIGLTSEKNREFVDSMAIYDQVLCYEEVESLATEDPVAYVDMAGNRPLLSRIHRHFTDRLTCSCGVGITHWDAREGEAPAELPGARPTMFFAPNQIQKRHQDWGPAAYQHQLSIAWDNFIGKVDDWVDIVRASGHEATQRTYLQVLEGAAPDQAFVLSLDEQTA